MDLAICTAFGYALGVNLICFGVVFGCFCYSVTLLALVGCFWVIWVVWVTWGGFA